MQQREQIIALGKVLAAELERGADDGAVQGGLEAYLAYWQAHAGAFGAEAELQKVLGLLADYRSQPLTVRQQRLSEALERLRTFFRTLPALPEPPAPDQPAPKKPRSKSKATTNAPAGETPPRPATPKARAAPKPLPAATGNELGLSDSLEQVPGMTRKDVSAFKRLGLRTVEDLLYHFPHRYDDFSTHKGIADLQIGTTATVVGEVSDVRLAGGPRPRVEMLLSDESGSLKVVYFNQPWLARQFSVGRKLTISGKVTSFNGMRQMTTPTWEPYLPDADGLHTGRLVPVHPLTKGLIERNARKIIKQVVDLVTPRLVDHLPAAVRERRGMLELGPALAQIHYPDNELQLARARDRLAFDEFLSIQLGVVQRRILSQQELGYKLPHLAELHAAFQAQLPFSLTGAQQRSLAQIFADLDRHIPMARLLQGDVGSGKTAVAAAALVQAIGHGFQGALMAPTEILAEQHYKGLRQLLSRLPIPRQAQQVSPDADWRSRLEPEQAARLAEIKALLGMTDEEDQAGQGVRVALLTGSLGARERRRTLEAIAAGEVDLVIGTHALITEGVRFNSLGLVVVDEQHRFGVEQRQRLRDKGFQPHMLVMTATPIPRTLTMTIYGDLDTSILDELPPGRQAIRTRWLRKAEREKAYRHLRKEIAKGRQAFVICPLVEESEKVDLPSAEEMYTTLQSEIFPDLRVALLHGRMLPREKDEVMVAFRERQFDLLVATAVIEVGIDIPNASTIMIEGAERFGLAQLHQFRGRVGRGQHQSYCILVSDKDDNEVTRRRLTAIEQTSDGFKLAEIDLELRGPGEFFGTRQSGTPDLKVARLADTRLLLAARAEAEAILAEDGQLAHPEHARLKQKMEAAWAEAVKTG